MEQKQITPPGIWDRFLDWAVLLGFSRIGFSARGLGSKDLPDGEGKTVVVTGATSGLGRAAALILAQKGAEVVALGRDQKKLEALIEEAGSGIVGFTADLSSVADTRRVAEEIGASYPTIDVLINNVGGLFPRQQETSEGIELTFATNLLGQFVLTRGLLDQITAAQGRIITVSSGGMYTAALDLGQLVKPDPYQGAAAYAQTKRAQVILNELWADLLIGDGVVCHAMHPGWAATPGVASGLPRFARVMRPILRTPSQGADTMVFLALDPIAATGTGLFWHDRKPRRTHKLRRTRESPETRIRLWEVLEEWASRIP